MGCEEFKCPSGLTGVFVTSDHATYYADHDWSLNLTYLNVELFNIIRKFNIKTVKNHSYDTSALIPGEFGGYAANAGFYVPCDLTVEGSMTAGPFSESISGFGSKILYADIDHKVLLIKKIKEEWASSYTTMNPFEYKEPYGGGNSVAYFGKLTCHPSVMYELYIDGEKKWEAADTEDSFEIDMTPIIWPVPASTAIYYTSAPYSWLEELGFYNYNDPADLGYSPCNDTGVISGDGFGTLTGANLTEADGGKDFFYPRWIRENVFLDVPMFHAVYEKEAAKRFRNYFGRTSEICSAEFTEDMQLHLDVSTDIIGNCVTLKDTHFLSFYLPEIEKAINLLGNEEVKAKFDAEVENAKIYYPLGLI